MKYLLTYIFLLLVISSRGQKQQYIDSQLVISNSLNNGYKYTLSHIEKYKNKWIAHYKLIPKEKYLCLFCNQTDCPAEDCRREKGIMFSLIDSNTVKINYLKGKISFLDVMECTKYSKNPGKDRKYTIIW